MQCILGWKDSPFLTPDVLKATETNQSSSSARSKAQCSLKSKSVFIITSKNMTAPHLKKLFQNHLENLTLRNMFILRFPRFTGACFRVFLLRYSLIPTWENKQMQLRRVHQSKVFMNSCREDECKDAPDISKHCTLTEPVQHSNGGATVCATNRVHSIVVLVWARGNTVHWSLIHTLTHTNSLLKIKSL